MTGAWPFLIARGRVRDYRTVLLPDVLTGSGAASALADALPIGEPGDAPRTTAVDDARLGAHRITAQARVLLPDEVGDPGGPTPFVADEHGRPLVYLFGLLSPASAPGEPGDRHLADARERALLAYRAFLADEAGFTAARSGPIEVPAATRCVPPVVPAPSNRGSAPPHPRPPNMAGRPRRISSLAVPAAALALLLLVLIVLLGRGGSTLSDLRVTAQPLAPNQQSCTDLRLSATVTVDGDRDVTFRVTSQDGRTALAEQHRLRPGQQTVELRPPPKGRADPAGVLTVVAEADGSSVSAPVEYRCSGG
jgi:hypothetical protein